MQLDDGDLTRLFDSGVILSSLDTLAFTFAADGCDLQLPWIWSGDWLNPPTSTIRHVQIPVASVDACDAALELLAKIPSIQEVSIVGDDEREVSPATHRKLNELLLGLPKLEYLAIQNLTNFERYVPEYLTLFPRIKALQVRAKCAKWLEQLHKTDFQPIALLFSDIERMPRQLCFERKRLHKLSFERMNFDNELLSIFTGASVSNLNCIGCSVPPHVRADMDREFPLAKINVL